MQEYEIRPDELVLYKTFYLLWNVVEEIAG
jgi:hypothetical protein